jgi:hypothetical protein
MNKQGLQQQLDDVTSEFLQLLSGFSQQQLDQAPARGWTAGQVGNHVWKSDHYVLKLLNEEGRPNDRDPAKEIEGLKKVFLDFTTKLESPPAIIPDNASFEKNALVQDLQTTRGQISQAIETSDLSSICSDPVLSEMTKLELIHFVLYHTQRHTRQLNNIYQELKEKTDTADGSR